MLIGLMGKSGSGKTTVSLLFKELNNNIKVLEVDKIGHKAYTDKEVKKKMRRLGSVEVTPEAFMAVLKLDDSEK